jgi:hypothetical protein
MTSIGVSSPIRPCAADAGKAGITCRASPFGCLAPRYREIRTPLWSKRNDAGLSIRKLRVRVPPGVLVKLDRRRTVQGSDGTTADA